MNGATVSQGSISDELIGLAGGINVFHVSPVNKTNWVASTDSIIVANPDIIVIENSSSKTNEQMKTNLGEGVTAVDQNKIYRIDGTTLTTSPRVVDALDQLAKWFHPELYT
jgi:ABC-type Fe3+-hydroxamate transport system substrate-binding protein